MLNNNKKKRGFTLIELLAVIVIIAIIALIATPLVLKYIDKARDESKAVSAENYLRAVETEVASKALKGENYFGKCLTLEEINSKLNVSVKGEKPESGDICFDNKLAIVSASLSYADGKLATYVDGKIEISKAIKEVFEDDVEFSYDSSMGAYSGNICIDTEKLIEFATYNLVVNDSSPIEMLGYIDEGFMFTTSSSFSAIMLSETDGCGVIMTDKLSAAGTYKVKLSFVKNNINPSVVRISSIDNHIQIMDSALDKGDVNLRITDSDDIEYANMNENVFGTGKFRYIEANIDSDSLENALATGKSIVITVTGTFNGQTITRTYGGSKFTYFDNIIPPYACNGENPYYYWGNVNIVMMGC